MVIKKKTRKQNTKVKTAIKKSKKSKIKIE